MNRAIANIMGLRKFFCIVCEQEIGVWPCMEKSTPDREPTWCVDCLYANLYPEQYAPWEKGCKRTIIRYVRLSRLDGLLRSAVRTKAVSAARVRDMSRGERIN